MKAANILLAIPMILFLTACASDSDDAPAEPRIFSLAQYNSVEYGTVLDFQFTGYDIDDIDYTGTYLVSNQYQIVRDGLVVAPRTVVMKLSVDGQASQSLSAISFLNQDGGFVDGYGFDETYCYSQSPNTVPNQVTIGDFGTLSTSVCDDGTTQEREWQILDAGNGNAAFVVYFTTKNEFGEIVALQDSILTINENGDFLEAKIVSTNADGYTRTIESTLSNNGPLSTSPTVIEP